MAVPVIQKRAFLYLSSTPKVGGDIFEEIQSRDEEAHLEKLHRAIINPDKFEKDLNKEINTLRAKLKIEKNRETLLSLKHQINALKKEKEDYLNLVNQFIKEIEFSKSPQEVDAHIEEINGQIFLLLGSPQEADDPILFESYANFLSDWLNKFHLAQKKSQKQLLRFLKRNLEQDFLLKNLTFLNIDENEENPSVILSKIENAVSALEKRADELCRGQIDLISEDNPTKKALIYKKYKILTAMKTYAWNSKNNFNERYNFSSSFYSVASIFSFCKNLATFARAIPGANLIADSVSKTFDFLSYLFLTTSQAIDPNISKERQVAARRHFKAMKKYNILETAMGGVGTLCLALGLTFAATGAVAAFPVIIPSLFVAGGLALTTSNIIATERYRKEINWLSNKLKIEYPDLIQRKKEILKKGEEDFSALTEKEQIFYRDARKIEAYKLSYQGKVADAVGTALATCLALSAVTTLIFPPAGLVLTGTVLMALTVATALSASYSLYKNYQTKKNYRQFKSAEKELEQDKINMILDLLKQFNWKPEVGREKEKLEKSEIESSAGYTPSFEFEISRDRSSEIETPQERPDYEPKKPTP